jgi:DNA-binding NarL/FixJ family response regulator
VTIRVLIVDDDALVRTGLSMMLAGAEDLRIVAEADDGDKVGSLVAEHTPDVVLMDIRMPDMDGLEATRLVTASSDVKVLILTTFDLDEYVYAALRGGASGFLLKDTPPGELLSAIRVVAAGDALLAPGITKRLIKEFATRPPLPIHRGSLPPTITEREREVLVLVAQGLSNREIAEHLHIGPGTAKTHVGHLLTKLAARDRVQLVIIAYRTGLVTAS